MSTATRWASWIDRGRRTTPGLAESAGTPPGVPILVDQFGTDLRLAVEIAWGAQPGSDSSGWSWTDVTSDVQVDSGKKVTVTIGRANEASTTQPAVMNLTLDNRRNLYSRSPLSPTYPNVVRNVPVRLRVIYQGTPFTRFQGYATGFTPAWDTTGNYAVVNLTANGDLRRLSQGSTTLRSPLERAVASSSPVAYWPMEDTAGSSSLTSAVPGVAPMFALDLNLAANSGLPGSSALPTFDNTGNATIVGEVPAWTPTQYWEVHWYHQLAVPAADTTVMYVTTTGTYKIWELVAGANSIATLNVYDALGNKTQITSVTFSVLFTNWAHVKIFVSESAGTLTWNLQGFPGSGGVGGAVSGTISGTAGIVTSVLSPPRVLMSGYSVGHVAVWKAPITNSGTIDGAGPGYNNENPVVRISRLCGEQGEQVTINRGSPNTMGVQNMDTFVNLLRACESVDQGMLYDGLNPGLTYTARSFRENAVPLLTLDASLQDLTPPFAPMDDDQLTVNSYTASRSGGSSYTATDTASTAAVGTYSSSGTYNTFADVDLQHIANWQVHTGTVDGYRYPQVAFSIHRRPQYLLSWLRTTLLMPIAVANLVSALSQMPPETLTMVLQGYTETYDQYLWDVVANTTPYNPWRIATVAAETGDTSEFAWRLESDGATLAQQAPAGSTSLSVSTPSGPLWTTAADDFPFSLSVAGIQVVVTNITGSSSPQTFTVQPTSYDLPARANVTLWNQPVLGL